MVSGMTERRSAVQPDETAVTHPSGWWKGSDCKWYRPDQQPAPEREPDRDDGARDLLNAMGMAAVAVLAALLLPRFLPTHSATAIVDVILLFGGTACAFLTRWWMFGRAV